MSHGSDSACLMAEVRSPESLPRYTREAAGKRPPLRRGEVLWESE